MDNRKQFINGIIDGIGQLVIFIVDKIFYSF